MPTRWPRRLAAGLAFAALASNAQADAGLTATAAVQRAAETFLASYVGEAGGATRTRFDASALDARLRLPACGEALEGFLPTGARPAARTTVGVRCAAPAWTVYVPVAAETELPVLVLKRVAPRLAALAATDVDIQTRRVPGFAGNYVTDVAELAGRHLRQPAAPGTALTVELLARDVLVRRGQRVTLLSRVGGIEVAAAGEAMADARPDGRVRVQNLGSRRVVEGVVETADRVRVGP